MNDQVVEQTETMAVISDVKHYAVDIDADGNEVRREIPALSEEEYLRAAQIGADKSV